MIRLLLADDQALVRGALSALLGLEPDLEVVAEVASGLEVVPAVLEHHPDVALLDVEMPGLDGISAAADGAAVAVIAGRVHLSPGTVRNHLSSAIGKTGAANRSEAVQIATSHGWL